MPAPLPVTSHDRLPARADTVVIGGGIVGASIALELAEAGQKVVLCEKGMIAGEQSGRNWGWCRQTGRDPREIPLIKVSLKLWRAMNTRVGADVGFHHSGIMYGCLDERQLGERERWLNDYARPHGLTSRMVSPAEIARLFPALKTPLKGALYTPDDGRAEPQWAAPALANAAAGLGALIFTHTAVRTLERQAGRISGVVTERGAIACRRVVLAAGAWSRRFLHNEGLRLPQLTVVNSVMRTEPFDKPDFPNLSAGRFAIRNRADGGITIAHNTLSVADIVPDSFRLFTRFLPALRHEWSGLRLRLGKRFIDEARLARRWSGDDVTPFEQVRILDPEPVHTILNDAHAGLAAAVPQFAAAPIAERWAGVIDVTPDIVPVIDEVAALPGLVIATGFSGHGFGLGPGAGRLAADLVLARQPVVDPRPFAYKRMTDGSRLKPMSEV